MASRIQDLTRSIMEDLARQQKQAKIDQRVQEVEKRILALFYDKKAVDTREVLGVFQIYAAETEGKDPQFWALDMQKVDGALRNLVSVGYLAEVGVVGAEVKACVGPAGRCYQLTAASHKILMAWHPNLMLQIKGWVSERPPWLISLAAVAGGIVALWNILNLLLHVARVLG